MDSGTLVIPRYTPNIPLRQVDLDSGGFLRIGDGARFHVPDHHRPPVQPLPGPGSPQAEWSRETETDQRAGKYPSFSGHRLEFLRSILHLAIFLQSYRKRRWVVAQYPAWHTAGVGR